MIYRYLMTSMIIIGAGTTGMGSDSLAAVDLSVADAILGLNSPNKEVRSKSINQLSRVTDDIWESIPYLYDDEADKKNRIFISEAKRHIKHLLTALKSNNPEVVSTAALVLAKLGPDARSSLPTLQKLFQCQKTTPEVRTNIFISLLHVTPKEKPLGPFLIDYFESIPNQQRIEINKLSDQTTNDPFSGAGIANTGIAYAGLFIDADRTVVEIPFLIKATSPKYPLIIRTISINILGHFQSDAESAIPDLQKLLQDKEKLIQVSTAIALVRIQKEPENVPILLEALNLNREEIIEFHKSINVLFKEEQQLKDLSGPDGAVVVQELVKLTKCKNGFYKRQAIIALGEIGPAAKAALPSLKKSLKDSDKETRRRTVEAIRKIDPMR